MNERIAPQYQDLQGRDSAMVTTADGGAVLRILAGDVDGNQGPGISHTPLAITHLTLAPGAQADIPWRRDFNALAYVLAGSGTVGAEGRPIRSGQLAVLGEGDTVLFRADDRQETRSPNLEVFLIGGVPLRQPVFAYGPFVMSTKAEVIEAFEDYQAGRLGRVPADAIQPHRPSGSK
jgi:redox-sensitive bicupin YhaK (pirin superfamily)